MANVMKNYKSYKGFKMSGSVGLAVCVLLMVLTIVFVDKLPFSAEVITALFIVSILGGILFTTLLIIGVVYGGIRIELDKALSMLDDSYVILYDITLPKYNNVKINVLIISPQGVYCIKLVAGPRGKIYGDDGSPKWRAYNRASSKARNTYFKNPVTEVFNQINAVKQKLSESGMDINIVPMVVFRDNTDLSEIKTSYPVMHASDAAQFIARNKYAVNLSPEQVAATLER